MSLLETFPHTLTFSRRTHLLSAIGGDKSTLTAYATGKKGWVQSARHAEVDRFQRRGQDISHTILLAPADQGLLQPGDAITVTAGDTFLASVFDVRSSGERTAGLGWMSTAFVELL